MTANSQPAYESQLRHLAEPAAPSEREKAVAATIEDFEALWFTDILREHAHYGDHDYEDEGDIAVAFASFIDAKVREQGQSYVTLYTHTHEAIETLLNALLEAKATRESVPIAIYNGIEDEFANAFIESEQTDDIEPKVVEMGGEETVVYDEEEARESYGMKQDAELEAEYEV